MSEKHYSVSELNNRIANILSDSFPYTILVKGEVVNVKKSKQGHIYFSLTDGKSSIDCIVWKNSAVFFKDKIIAGKTVLLEAEINVYVQGGRYSLIVKNMLSKGEGDRKAAFEKLKAKLASEGLFLPERKKPLPTYPKNVGIVTSRNGAAVRDIVKIINRRAPFINIFLFSAAVQGDAAIGDIVNGIKAHNNMKRVDVLIVGRGGGSEEDLSIFNDEAVVREIANSKIPVITAIGHEVDFSLSDLVADKRAETPSAAAEIVTENYVILKRELDKKKYQLYRAIKEIFNSFREKANYLKKRFFRKTPTQILNEKKITVALCADRMIEKSAVVLGEKKRKFLDIRQRLNNLSEKIVYSVKEDFVSLEKRFIRKKPQIILNDKVKKIDEIKSSLLLNISHILEEKRSHFLLFAKLLDEKSPMKPLTRGYSILFKNGDVVRSVNELDIGDEVDVKFNDGVAGAKILKKEVIDE